MGAIRAAESGLKTLMIEKRALGGVCLNEGCIPSKTILNSAKIYDYARFSKPYGVTTKEAYLDHKAVVRRKKKVVRTLVAGIRTQLRQAGAKTIDGKAFIEGKSENGFIVSVENDQYTGKHLLIATGSEASIPPIDGVNEGLEKGNILTSREIFDIEEIPESFVVIGGGAVGLEMASYFNSAGSNVTVIEMLDHIAPGVDAEISDILRKSYEDKGIKFVLSATVTGIDDDKVLYEQNGERYEIDAAKVLLSVGRRPNIQDIGLENIGVDTDGGAILVDDEGRTNVANVYAAGDVNGKSMLAHTAYREAEVIINNILGKEDKVRYETIASVIYTSPEVATIGETEESCKEKGIAYDMVELPMQYSGRYVAENERGTGMCKLLANKEDKRLIGVHMIGSYTSEIIYGVAAMMESEMDIDSIKKIVFPHPTVSEVIREGIFQF
ncbi:MAG: dihydrolipoyl dehydrogenase [Clostridiales bacterium]|nr:dihydrolipoyl dehydrogenase [Clostridiales bacterium]